MRSARVVACGCAMILGACATGRPGWVEHTPRGYAYDYAVGVGSDTLTARARSAAIAMATARFAEASHARVRVSRADTVHRSEVVDEARKPARLVQRYGGSIAVSVEAPPVERRDLRVVAEFAERSRAGVDVWVLMRAPLTAGARRPPSAHALALRSAVVPGWGQWVKEQPGKGTVIFGGVITGATAAVALHSMRADAKLRAERARTAVVRTYWRDRANGLQALGDGVRAATALTYLYAIADAGAGRAGVYSWTASPRVIGVSIPLHAVLPAAHR